MEVERPHLVILAGPNGAGKSTMAPVLLAEGLHVTEFVNADVIAQGLSAFRPEGVAVEAGRVMLERLRQLAAMRSDFAIETTLAGRSYAPWIKRLRQTGYVVDLVFLWLPSPEAAVARVRERVRLGGHAIPEDTIRRRYHSGMRNFFELYRSLVDRWHFFVNRDFSGPEPIAAGRGEVAEKIVDLEVWIKVQEALTREHNRPTHD